VIARGGQKLLMTRENSLAYNNQLFFIMPLSVREDDTFTQCEYVIEDTDEFFKDIQLESSGKRVSKLYYQCYQHEQCCGLECCKGESEGGRGIYIFLVFIAMFVLIIVCYAISLCMQLSFGCCRHNDNWEPVHL